MYKVRLLLLLKKKIAQLEEETQELQRKLKQNTETVKQHEKELRLYFENKVSNKFLPILHL